jgi:hypothetical protein
MVSTMVYLRCKNCGHKLILTPERKLTHFSSIPTNMDSSNGALVWVCGEEYAMECCGCKKPERRD